MAKRLAGKNAIVTGGAGGIGSQVCLALAAEGANVLVADMGAARGGGELDTSRVDKVVEDVKAKGVKSAAIYESVGDFAAAEKIVKTCVDTFGSLDILVNMAGPLRERMIWNLSEEDWDIVVNSHLKGTFNMCRHAMGVMRKQKKGRIVNTTSDAWRGTVGQANYGAAKAGIVGLTRSVAREGGGMGITCNAIAPIAATRMTMTPEVEAGMKKRLDDGLITKEFYDNFMSMGGPEYIAPMVVYLATDDAANINGQVFHIEKGRVGYYSEPVEVKSIYKQENKGMWTVDDLVNYVPATLLQGYVNPAPVKK